MKKLPVRRNRLKTRYEAGGRPRVIKAAAGNSYRSGYERGYIEGMRKGRETYDEPFHGTSIVIPTYNQADYLKQCIASIEANTPEPYEIIVVDNASSDGTGDYLRQQTGQIRTATMERNLGFAGGVNHGLLMAKGDTIVILNNDTLVTPGWLGNMLHCLNSDPHTGAVGPVTNYISGEQQIEVPYTSVDQMWSYAASYRVPDSGKWRETERLVGFCLLFSRDLLQSIGYFDEGYRIGNYEDEDWIIRVRISGHALVIAGDAFIHHYGSVSMKKLGEHFTEVQNGNEQFYFNKWDDPYAWVHKMQEYTSIRSTGKLSSFHFYPSHVLIQDQEGRTYILRHGHKYELTGKGLSTGMPPTLLSRLDIRHIPDGGETSDDEGVLMVLKAAEADDSKNLIEGQLVRSADGDLYQWERGGLRPFVSSHSLHCWQMENRANVLLPPETLKALPEGLPIIAPPLLYNSIL